MTTGVRFFVSLAAIAAVTLFMSVAQAQPISIAPTKVGAGTSVTLTISSSAFFLNLAQLSPSQITINPAGDISNLRTSNPGAERLTLSFDLARTAVGGTRTVNIQVTDDVIVSIRFVVERDPQVCSPACIPPRRCEMGLCKFPE
jgi:hypothetical protein